MMARWFCVDPVRMPSVKMLSLKRLAPELHPARTVVVARIAARRVRPRLPAPKSLSFIALLANYALQYAMIKSR